MKKESVIKSEGIKRGRDKIIGSVRASETEKQREWDINNSCQCDAGSRMHSQTQRSHIKGKDRELTFLLSICRRDTHPTNHLGTGETGDRTAGTS